MVYLKENTRVSFWNASIRKKKLDSKHDKKDVNLDLEKFLIGLTRHQHLHIKFKGQLLVLLSQ